MSFYYTTQLFENGLVKYSSLACQTERKWKRIKGQDSTIQRLRKRVLPTEAMKYSDHAPGLAFK